MAGVGFTVKSGDLAALPARIDRLQTGLKSGELQLLMGTAVREVVREHFYELQNDTEHHETAQSLGAASTGFYLAAADATQAPEQESDGVSISINHQGLSQRLHGGKIKGDPLLTIPARAEAYGKRAREFDNLKLVVFATLDLLALVAEDEEESEGLVYYWLVREVEQDPDPTVLPEDDDMLDPAIAEAEQFADLLWERKAGS